MKRLILMVVLVVFTFVVCSCSSQVGIDVGKTNERIIEWVSPDGVHYWIYKSHYKFALAPRYNHYGELVIDDKAD